MSDARVAIGRQSSRHFDHPWTSIWLQIKADGAASFGTNKGSNNKEETVGYGHLSSIVISTARSSSCARLGAGTLGNRHWRSLSTCDDAEFCASITITWKNWKSVVFLVNRLTLEVTNSSSSGRKTAVLGSDRLRLSYYGEMVCHK